MRERCRRLPRWWGRGHIPSAVFGVVESFKLSARCQCGLAALLLCMASHCHLVLLATDRTVESVLLRTQHTSSSILVLEMTFAAQFIRHGPRSQRLGYSLVGLCVFIVLLGLPARDMRDESDAVSFAQRPCAHNAGYFQRAYCKVPRLTRALVV